MGQACAVPPMIRVRPRRRALMAVPVVLAALAGCSSAAGNGSQELTPGPNASEAACTKLMTRLPATVLSRTRNTAQEPLGIATWGDPAIELSCGATPTGPTPDHAFAVNEVCWVITESTSSYTFLTYGRDPAVLVRVPTSIERTEATSALVDLDKAVSALKQSQHRCLDLDDTAPTPTAS
jgi:hypothetical protein